MALKKIKLPDNSVVEVQDARIPAPQSTDNGKVLGVTSAAGTLGWVEQSGGEATPTLLIGNLTDEEKAQNIAVIEGLYGEHTGSFSVAQTLDFVYNGAVYAEYALHQINKIDDNTYHLTVSLTYGEYGGYTALYKLIIQGGEYTDFESLSETVQARIIGVSSLNYGTEGEEHTVTWALPSSIIPYADAPTVNTCNYYIAGYGLSYGYNKQSTYYECFFESGERTMRLRVYSDGHVTTLWYSKAQSITYTSLKTMRDNARLEPGKKYRITDYVTTTTDTESRSLAHPFDIIVQALDASHLNEEALAAQHSGDTYFANTNFAAWKIWYCLDNDTTRFAWADATNGKGVIYRMIDEWGNDVPYDFKNIQFKRYKVTAKTAYTVNSQSIDLTASLGVCNGLYIGLSGTKSRGFDIDSSDYKWYFTFSRLGSTWDADIEDASLTGAGANNNTYGAVAYSGAVALNNIVNANGQVVTDFRKGINSNITSAYYYTDTVSENCHFGENVSHISHFGSASNTFGQSQYRNNICVGVAQRHNTLGSDVENNSVIAIYDNAFNTLGSAFHSNVVAIFNSFTSNTIDDEGNSNYFFSNAIASGMGWLYTNISTSFESNIIVASKFDQQTIGPLFRRNNISCTFSSNRIGPMFQDNTIAGTQFAYNTTKSSFYNNTINGEITSLIANVSGHHNVFNGQIGHVIMDGQITYCTLNGPIKNSSFFGILQYITIAAGTSTSQFACCDIKGNIRGTSSVPITLDASQFRLASLSGVNRRITIEGQADGKITATWMDGGKRVGIYKTQGDATWTALPEAYYKPSTGIPASDLAEDTVATVSPRMYVGTCATAAATATKVVTVETFPLDENGKPLVGTMIAVKSTYTNSAAAFTLNVNSTGAASIYYSGGVSTTNVTAGYANRYTYYVWDGTYWVWLSGGVDNNDNTLAFQVRTNNTSRYLSDFVSRYRLLFTSADGSKWVPANTSTNTTTTAAKAVNQRPINPFGDIVYYNSTTTRSAGAEVGVTTQFFKVHGISLGYSFNRTGSALALTSFAPVYVVCKPATDGSAIIDGNTPIVQALPTTEDGKIYIFLGLAYSGTALELFPNHPVYWYKDGAIRLYTNSNSNTQKEEDENISGYLSRAIGSNESWTETLATGTMAEGYISGADGAITATSEYWNYYTIPLGTAKKVRFNGFAPNEPPSSSDAWNSGYAFYDSNDNCIASANWAIDTSLPAHTEKEFIVDVPTGATTLRVTNAKDDAYYCYTKKRPFYCYLMEGKTISEMSVQAVNTCTKIWAGTQAQYDLLTPDSDTLYLITG